MNNASSFLFDVKKHPILKLIILMPRTLFSALIIAFARICSNAFFMVVPLKSCGPKVVFILLLSLDFSEHTLSRLKNASFIYISINNRRRSAFYFCSLWV